MSPDSGNSLNDGLLSYTFSSGHLCLLLEYTQQTYENLNNQGKQSIHSPFISNQKENVVLLCVLFFLNSFNIVS